ncbi:MAG: hypothetical protein ACLFR7_02660 [Opitutales bacterium]
MEPKQWTLEIVPGHADRVGVFKGLVEEIFITMIPGSPVENCVQAMREVVEKGFRPVPHVVARNFATEAALTEFFAEVRRLEVPKALLLAGGQSEPAGPFASTRDLLQTEAFRESGLRTVAVAGHPEGNPDDPQSQESLLHKWEFLCRQDIAMEIVTQWSFSAENVDAYLERLASLGLDVPVRVGIPGPASLKTLLKYAQVCGVGASTTALKKQGLNMGRLLVSSKPDKFVADISRSDRFHLYPFGGLEKCAQWLQSRRESQTAASTASVADTQPAGGRDFARGTKQK